MATVADGVIKQLSVSQAERFDPKQKAGCPRAWYFEQIEGRKEEDTRAKTDGDIGHDLLAKYLLTGNPPEGRVKMGKAVRGAIDAGNLPAPGADLHVERRFDGQPKLGPDGKWLPLNRETTFWLGGIPWDGFIDLRFRRSEVVDVLDHKFSSDIYAPWTKHGDDLINTIQMPLYALDSLRVWPDANEFRFTHHYVSRRGVDSSVRTSPIVTRDQLLERKEEIESVVGEMKLIATVDRQDHVPFNRGACGAYMGCPHQAVCKAFKEKKKVDLNPEEAALFGELSGVTLTSTPAPKVETVEEADPFADLVEPAPVVKAEEPKPRAPITDSGKEIRCSRCVHSFGMCPTGHVVPMTNCPNVNAHGADCSDCGHPLSLTSDGPRCPNAAKHAPKVAAVVPPDAPLNSADVPAPEKAKRKTKAKTEAPAAISSILPDGRTFELPDGGTIEKKGPATVQTESGTAQPSTQRVEHVIKLDPDTAKLIGAAWRAAWPEIAALFGKA